MAMHDASTIYTYTCLPVLYIYMCVCVYPLVDIWHAWPHSPAKQAVSKVVEQLPGQLARPQSSAKQPRARKNEQVCKNGPRDRLPRTAGLHPEVELRLKGAGSLTRHRASSLATSQHLPSYNLIKPLHFMTHMQGSLLQPVDSMPCMQGNLMCASRFGGNIYTQSLLGMG